MEAPASEVDKLLGRGDRIIYITPAAIDLEALSPWRDLNRCHHLWAAVGAGVEADIVALVRLEVDTWHHWIIKLLEVAGCIGDCNEQQPLHGFKLRHSRVHIVGSNHATQVSRTPDITC